MHKVDGKQFRKKQPFCSILVTSCTFGGLFQQKRYILKTMKFTNKIYFSGIFQTSNLLCALSKFI